MRPQKSNHLTRSIVALTCLLLASVAARAEDTHAFPNPYVAKSSDLATIAFTPLPTTGTIKIYTIDGQEIRTLDIHAGEAIVSWDTRNSGGKSVATGVYYFRVNGDSNETTGKLIIIR